MFDGDGKCTVSFEELREKVNRDLAALAFNKEVSADLFSSSPEAQEEAVSKKAKEEADMFEEVSLMDRKVAAYKEWRRRAEGGSIAGGWQAKYLSLIDDYAQVWLPGAKERQTCCNRIDMRDEEVKQCPYKLMTHCQSQGHVAMVYDVDPKEFRHYTALLEREHKKGNG